MVLCFARQWLKAVNFFKRHWLFCSFLAHFIDEKKWEIVLI